VNSRKDWDGLANQLAGKTRARSKSSAAEVVVGFITSCMALSFLFGISAFAIMLLNMVAINAWPNIESIDPGVGFTDAYLLSSLLWALIFIRSIVSVSLIAAAQRGANK